MTPHEAVEMEAKVTLRVLDQYGGYIPPEQVRLLCERAARRVHDNAHAFGVSWPDEVGWKSIAHEVALSL